jgi:hypothetical protein
LSFMDTPSPRALTISTRLKAIGQMEKRSGNTRALLRRNDIIVS